MDLGLKGRVALVCAASRGIGRAIAESLAREGVVVAICARDNASIHQTAQEIATATGGKVFAYQADVGVPADVTRLLHTVHADLGPIAILIHNAGGPSPGGLGVVTEAQWREGLDLGLMSLIQMTEAVVPAMKAAKFGRIVAIASTTVLQPKEDLLISSAVRAGVAGFLKAISHNLAKDNVLVHTVCPGPTRTQRMIDLATRLADQKGISVEAAEAGLIADVPMGRMGRPEEVGDFVACLVSGKLGFSTGLTVAVDGGQTKALM